MCYSNVRLLTQVVCTHAVSANPLNLETRHKTASIQFTSKVTFDCLKLLFEITTGVFNYWIK